MLTAILPTSQGCREVSGRYASQRMTATAMTLPLISQMGKSGQRGEVTCPRWSSPEMVEQLWVASPVLLGAGPARSLGGPIWPTVLRWSDTHSPELAVLTDVSVHSPLGLHSSV